MGEDELTKEVDRRIFGQHAFCSGTRFLDKDLHGVSGRSASSPEKSRSSEKR